MGQDVGTDFFIMVPMLREQRKHGPVFGEIRFDDDAIKVEDVNRFEAKFLSEIRAKGADILAAIRTDKQITSATEEKLKAFLDGFAKVFA